MPGCLAGGRLVVVHPAPRSCVRPPLAPGAACSLPRTTRVQPPIPTRQVSQHRAAANTANTERREQGLLDAAPRPRLLNHQRQGALKRARVQPSGDSHRPPPPPRRRSCGTSCVGRAVRGILALQLQQSRRGGGAHKPRSNVSGTKRAGPIRARPVHPAQGRASPPARRGAVLAVVALVRVAVLI